MPDKPKRGQLRNIESDFAAIIAPGLRCAFQDRQRVTLEGRTLFDEKHRARSGRAVPARTSC